MVLDALSNLLIGFLEVLGEPLAASLFTLCLETGTPINVVMMGLNSSSWIILVGGILQKLLLLDQVYDFKIVNGEDWILFEQFWTFRQQVFDFNEFKVRIDQKLILVISIVVLFENWLNRSASQLLVNSPPDLSNKLSNLLIELNLLLGSPLVQTTKSILALQVNPDSLDPLLFILLGLPELVLHFQ